MLRLLRHAKSDWSQTELADHERPLNTRGRKACDLVAADAHEWPTDIVVSSTALRACETAGPVADAIGCAIVHDRRIYGASASELITLIRDFDGSWEDVLLVGHNPGLEELAEALCGSAPVFPTAALATIAVDVEQWPDVAPGSGRLIGFATPATRKGRGR